MKKSVYLVYRFSNTSEKDKYNLFNSLSLLFGGCWDLEKDKTIGHIENLNKIEHLTKKFPDLEVIPCSQSYLI